MRVVRAAEIQRALRVPAVTAAAIANAMQLVAARPTARELRRSLDKIAGYLRVARWTGDPRQIAVVSMGRRGEIVWSASRGGFGVRGGLSRGSPTP